jgi:hypothetical protein
VYDTYYYYYYSRLRKDNVGTTMGGARSAECAVLEGPGAAAPLLRPLCLIRARCLAPRLTEAGVEALHAMQAQIILALLVAGEGAGGRHLAHGLARGLGADRPRAGSCCAAMTGCKGCPHQPHVAWSLVTAATAASGGASSDSVRNVRAAAPPPAAHPPATHLPARLPLLRRPVYGEAMAAPRVLEGAALLFQVESHPAARAYAPLLPEDFLVGGVGGGYDGVRCESR